MHGEWLVRGYFNLSADGQPTVTQEVKGALSAALGSPLKIKMYPVGPAWRYTFWWREGSADYAEAQFYVRIDEDCPVLSAWVTVEKGREGAAADTAPSERMERRTWQWQRLIERRENVLEADVPEIAARVQRPISVRVRAYQPGSNGELSLPGSTTFCFANSQWSQRHRGTADVSTIASHLQWLDQQKHLWVDLYFAVDLGPHEVEGMTAAELASVLIRFQPIRQRLTA